MGLCSSCFETARADDKKKAKPSAASHTPRTVKEESSAIDYPRAVDDDDEDDDRDDDDDQQHPAVIEMTAFRQKEQSAASEKSKDHRQKKKHGSSKSKSIIIPRTASLTTTVIREHDSSRPPGQKVPRRRPSGSGGSSSRSTTGRLSPVKLKTQRNINPHSIRIRDEVVVQTATADHNNNNNNNIINSSKASASLTALANFQKLKLQVEVAKKHQQRQQKVRQMEEEVQEADQYKSLWNEYTTIQRKTASTSAAVMSTPPPPPVEYDLRNAAGGKQQAARNAANNNNSNAKQQNRRSLTASRFVSGGASVRSFLSQRSRNSTAKSDSGFRKSASSRPEAATPKAKSKTSSSTSIKSRQSRRTQHRQSRSGRSQRQKDEESSVKSCTQRSDSSFDLKETQTWYFDFDDLSPTGAAKSVAGSTGGKSQASLSLLSETSLAVQRRLYEEKRRQRKERYNHRQQRINGGGGTASGTHHSQSASKCPTESSLSSSQVDDYGPVSRHLRRRPSQESLNFSFTDMEVVAAPADNSMLSDLDNDSLSYLSMSSRESHHQQRHAKDESGPPVVYNHDAVVQRRLDIEAQLRALQAASDEEEEDDDSDIDMDDVEEPAFVSSSIAAGTIKVETPSSLPKPDPAGTTNDAVAADRVVELPPTKATAAAADNKAEDEAPVEPTLDITLSLRRIVDKSPRKLVAPKQSLLQAVQAQTLQSAPARTVGREEIVLPRRMSSNQGSNKASSEDLPVRATSSSTKIQQSQDASSTRATSDPVGGKIQSSPRSNSSPGLLTVCTEAAPEELFNQVAPSKSDACSANEFINLDLPDDESRDLAIPPRVAQDESPSKARRCSEPVLNLNGPKARLTQRMPVRGIMSPHLALSPTDPRVESNVASAGLRPPLDESIASEEEIQLFRIPYGTQTPSFGLPMGGSHSDSMVVNQSVDDSMDVQSVEGDPRAFGTQPRVLLSSLQSPNSVLDARETLELAEKVEAHVHDVLHRYRSEDLYRN